MSRTEFVIATAIILFVAFCLGWFANWLIHRFTRIASSDVAELDRMSQELHEAEETRDQAITYLQQLEAELTNQLAQTEAELAAAMEQGEAHQIKRGQDRMEGLARGYVAFATDNPALFQLMFGPMVSDLADSPTLFEAGSRAYQLMETAVAERMQERKTPGQTPVG